MGQISVKPGSLQKDVQDFCKELIAFCPTWKGIITSVISKKDKSPQCRLWGERILAINALQEAASEVLNFKCASTEFNVLLAQYEIAVSLFTKLAQPMINDARQRSIESLENMGFGELCEGELRDTFDALEELKDPMSETVVASPVDLMKLCPEAENTDFCDQLNVLALRISKLRDRLYAKANAREGLPITEVSLGSISFDENDNTRHPWSESDAGL